MIASIRNMDAAGLMPPLNGINRPSTSSAVAALGAFNKAAKIILSCVKVYLDRVTSQSKGFECPVTDFVSCINPMCARNAISTVDGEAVGKERLKIQLKHPKATRCYQVAYVDPENDKIDACFPIYNRDCGNHCNGWTGAVCWRCC
ncbi:CUGBP Elav-like family member 5 [Taenia solium]|eukprot:TsM_000383900 transcript=TsM_000383900 gene=TsM_000383900